MLGGISIGATEYILLGLFGLLSTILWEYFKVTGKICDRLPFIKNNKESLVEKLNQSDLEEMVDGKINEIQGVVQFNKIKLLKFYDFMLDIQKTDYVRIPLKYIPKVANKVIILFEIIDIKEMSNSCIIVKTDKDGEINLTNHLNTAEIIPQEDFNNNKYIEFRIDISNEVKSKLLKRFMAAKYVINRTGINIYIKSFKYK